MRILVVPSWYRTRRKPTLGSFFLEQAQALVAHDLDVTVADATSVPKSELWGNALFRLRRESYQRVEELRHRWPTLLGLGHPPLLELEFRACLGRILRVLAKEERLPDVIHAHSFFPAGMAAVRLGADLGIPVVVTEHRSDVNTRILSPWEQRGLAEVVAMAGAFLCVSRALAQSVVELTGTKKPVEVVPNMVSPLFDLPGPGPRLAGFHFLSVGNLKPIKGFDLLLNSFAQAFSGRPDVTLDIVGEGVEREALQRQIGNLGLDGQVRLCGPLPRAEVAFRMGTCDAFVLASHSETFGLVYAEALACGRPVVATCNGGIEDILDGTQGFLVPAGDVTALAQALERMLEEAAEFDPARIRQDCLAKFSESAVVSRLLRIYADQINRREAG